MPADVDHVPVVAADGGQPVMITRAVPQQVAAYQLMAREIQTALAAAGDNSAG